MNTSQAPVCLQELPIGLPIRSNRCPKSSWICLASRTITVQFRDTITEVHPVTAAEAMEVKRDSTLTSERLLQDLPQHQMDHQTRNQMLLRRKKCPYIITVVQFHAHPPVFRNISVSTKVKILLKSQLLKSIGRTKTTTLRHSCTGHCLQLIKVLFLGKIVSSVP